MKLSILFLILAGLCFPQATMVTRVVEFEPDGTAQADTLAKLMSVTGVGVHVEGAVKLLLITGPEERVKEAEALFRKYYKPKPLPAVSNRNIELTLHVVLGKQTINEMIDIAPALNPVIAQLRQATAITSFRNIETQIMRVREGEKIEANGVLSWTDAPDSYSPTYHFRTLVQSTGPAIRLNSLNFTTRVPLNSGNDPANPSNTGAREFGLTSSLDIKPGQYVVVGKVNASAKNGALILILSARLVD